MVIDLLKRDLRLARRTLIGAALAALLITAASMLDAGQRPLTAPDAWLVLGIGMWLLALLPASLHLLEANRGTLADLLVLPIRRRDVVRLRMLEGLLGCAAYLVGYLIITCLLIQPPAALLLAILRGPSLLWVPCLVLAISLPFTLGGDVRGLGLAMLTLTLGYAAVMSVNLLAPGRLLPALQHAADLVRTWRAAGSGLGARLMDGLGPLLLLLGSYRISVWALERRDL